MIEIITNDLKLAMKSQNKPKITGLRNLLGKLKAIQIDKGSNLEDAECIKILTSAAKQLKDSIEQYSNANRLDLAEKENYELKLVQEYLPEQMNIDDVKKEIMIIIKNNNATSTSDMGKIMGIAMKQFSGSIDGNIVQKIVKEQLNK